MGKLAFLLSHVLARVGALGVRASMNHKKLDKLVADTLAAPEPAFWDGEDNLHVLLLESDKTYRCFDICGEIVREHESRGEFLRAMSCSLDVWHDYAWLPHRRWNAGAEAMRLEYAAAKLAQHQAEDAEYMKKQGL